MNSDLAELGIVGSVYPAKDRIIFIQPFRLLPSRSLDINPQAWNSLLLKNMV